MIGLGPLSLHPQLEEVPLAQQRLGHTPHALHAAEVTLPWRGGTRMFQAAWPADLDALWQD